MSMLWDGNCGDNDHGSDRDTVRSVMSRALINLGDDEVTDRRDEHDRREARQMAAMKLDYGCRLRG